MMREFKFLNDNKDDGIIGAYNEADILVQLTDRYIERTFYIPLPLIYSIRCKAFAFNQSPLTVNNDIEYQGLFSYRITSTEEIGDGQIRYWATIWFRSPTGNILCYHITEDIR